MRGSPQHDNSGGRFPVAYHHRHRNRAVLVVCGVAVLVIVGLVLYSLTSLGSSAAADALAVTSWLTPATNGFELQTALHQQSRQNTPSAYSLSLNQILFVSCNRHDRSQAYWAIIAAAAQCELLARGDRAAAPPCRRLYAGQSPLSLDGGILPEEETWVKTAPPLSSLQEVPLGACGAVYDSAAAAAHRASLLAAREDAAAQQSPATPLRFPLSPLRTDPPPLDALLWLGDAIYADKRADGHDGQSLLYQHSNTLAEVGRFWRTQRDAPVYNAFVASCVATSPATASGQQQLRRVAVEEDGAETTARPAAKQAEVMGEAEREDELIVPQPPTFAQKQHNVWGTWDDHDMGKNDGGREYPHRNVTQRFFLDFLRAPATDPRWTREGVYEAYTLPFHAVVDNTKGWGPALEALLRQLYEHAMCVVLLDVRSFRDAPNASHAGDMLGSEQWNWFEGQLQRFTTATPDGRQPCAVTLIGSGIQFMLDEKPAENWAAFPAARDRLLGLLRLYQVERVAFLTGDVHLGELGGDFTAATVRRVLGYPLLEATSSGLTHSANMFFLSSILPRSFPSPRRLAIYVEKNFGTVRLSLDLFHLPRLRHYLNDSYVDGATKETLVPVPRRWTAEQRQSIRTSVQRALNLTFTIFSLPQQGQPVYRLNAPLSMLTYADGARYIDATVDPFHGNVHVRNVATDPAAELPAVTTTTIALRNGTVVAVAHYPNTTPAPFVTWAVRLAQRYVFTGCSVSETLKCCIILAVGAALVLSAQAVAWVLRRLRRKPWRRCQPLAPHQPSVASPLLVRSVELLEESHGGHLRWWDRLVRGFQKSKRR